MKEKTISTTRRPREALQAPTWGSSSILHLCFSRFFRLSYSNPPPIFKCTPVITSSLGHWPKWNTKNQMAGWDWIIVKEVGRGGGSEHSRGERYRKKETALSTVSSLSFCVSLVKCLAGLRSPQSLHYVHLRAPAKPARRQEKRK